MASTDQPLGPKSLKVIKYGVEGISVNESLKSNWSKTTEIPPGSPLIWKTRDSQSQSQRWRRSAWQWEWDRPSHKKARAESSGESKTIASLFTGNTAPLSPASPTLLVSIILHFSEFYAATLYARFFRLVFVRFLRIPSVFADHVFDETCSNARVYELLTKDIIHAAVEGFNGSSSFIFFGNWLLSLVFLDFPDELER